MVPWKVGFGYYLDVASVSSLSVRRLNPFTISMSLAFLRCVFLAALVGHQRHLQSASLCFRRSWLSACLLGFLRPALLVARRAVVAVVL